MFDAAKSGRSWLGAFVVVSVLSGLAAAGLRPEWFASALEQADLVARGVAPGATLVASERHEQPYERSPLLLAMALESAWVEVDPTQGSDLADAVADDVGRWLLRETGADDVHEAERALWAAGRQDELFVWLAKVLRDREVHARSRHRLSEPEPAGEGQPIYVHPDDLAWLMAHVAWRLDLRTELVRSPVHHYLVARAPDGDAARAVEATCFRRVDALGKVVQSDQPSVGRRLLQPEGHYPSGVGGIRNPDPLPPGAYESFLDDDALALGIVERLEARHGPIEVEPLCEQAATAGVTLERCQEAP